MDIRDLVIGKLPHDALREVIDHITDVFGTYSYLTRSSDMLRISYPKFEFQLGADIKTLELKINISSYDQRVNKYLSTVGSINDLEEFKQVVEILTEGG